MVDAFNITQDRIARSRLAGDPPDIMISPKLAKMGLFEFHRARGMHRARPAGHGARPAGHSRTASGDAASTDQAVAIYSLIACVSASISARRMLHHVADRDDAGQASALDHRAHGGTCCWVMSSITSLMEVSPVQVTHLRGHETGDRLLQGLGAVHGNRPHDIPLRNDAGDGPAGHRTTRTAPILRSARILAASLKVCSGSMVTTSRPLSERI